MYVSSVRKVITSCQNMRFIFVVDFLSYRRERHLFAYVITVIFSNIRQEIIQRLYALMNTEYINDVMCVYSVMKVITSCQNTRFIFVVYLSTACIGNS